MVKEITQVVDSFCYQYEINYVQDNWKETVLHLLFTKQENVGFYPARIHRTILKNVLGLILQTFQNSSFSGSGIY